MRCLFCGPLSSGHMLFRVVVKMRNPDYLRWYFKQTAHICVVCVGGVVDSVRSAVGDIAQLTGKFCIHCGAVADQSIELMVNTPQDRECHGAWRGCRSCLHAGADKVTKALGSE